MVKAKKITSRSSHSHAAHWDVQHSAPARAWLRQFSRSKRSVLNAAYLDVSLRLVTMDMS